MSDAGYRLSPPQRALWRQGAPAACRSLAAVELLPGVDTAAVRAALEALVARHEVLRTRFVRPPGAAVAQQVIDARGGLAWDQPPGEAAPDLDALWDAALARPLSPEHGPALHAVVSGRVLVLALHALHCDGAGLRGLLDELDARLGGRTDADEPMQYADVAAWMNELVESDEGRDARALRTPAAGAGLARTAFEDDSAGPFEPRARLVARLPAHTQGDGPALALACWNELLARLCGAAPLLGLGLSGRGYEGLGALPGLFARSVPALLGREPESTPLEAARAAAAALDEAARWQEYVERDESGAGPAYVFDLTPAPPPASHWRLLREHAVHDRFRLRLEWRALPVPEVWLHADRAVVAEAGLDTLGEQLATLLEAARARPGEPFARLGQQSPREREALLRTFNATARDYPRETCVHTLFEQQAARTPDATALVCGPQRLTYGELNRGANRLAQDLIARGVGPDVPVALCAPRSVELVAGVLAVLKAGGAYVPLDPSHPPARLDWLLRDSGARLLLHAGPPPVAPPPGVESVPLALRADAAGGGSDPARGVLARHLAYLLYTSGSSGRPKGCAVEHRSVVNYLCWLTREHLGAAACGDFALHSPLAFDFTVTSLFASLLRGRTLHVHTPDAAVDAVLRRDFAPGSGVDIAKLTPSHVRLLGELDLRETGVRQVIVGGEALLPRELDVLARLRPAPLVLNEYGPTEATVGCVAGTAEAGARVTIGRPIANTQAYVLDAQGEPAPIGVAGELVLAGDCLARGYHGQPAQTAERFVPHPFAAGQRLYRTGDLGRVLPDGRLEYLGRIDQQVKIRGQRVEPGEVEALLASFPGVRDVAVTCGADPAGEARLEAYVVADAPAAVVPEALRAFAAERLPEALVPTLVTLLEALPLTPNGKLDRAALRAGDRRSGTGHDLPRDPLELELLRLWEDVLGVRPIGLRDDFFALGGQSFLAVQLASRLQRRFRVELPLAEIVRSPTVEALAERLRRAHAPAFRELVEMQAQGDAPALFLLPGAGGNVVYFNPLVRRLGIERPVFGLQTPGLDGRSQPARGVPELARRQIGALREVQPRGPYHLAGHSFGARVAYEMNRQLQEAGESVALLVVFDSVAPLASTLPPDISSPSGWLARVALEIEHYVGRPLGVREEDLAGRDEEAQLDLVVERLLAADLWPPGADTSMLRGFVNVYRANRQADYAAPDARPVPVLLLKGAGDEEEDDGAEGDETSPEVAALRADETWGWSRLASSVEVETVPGGHVTLFREPHVQVVAERLRAALERAGRGPGRQPGELP